MNRRTFIELTGVTGAGALFSGCAIFGGSNGIEYDYPSDIKNQCVACREDAKRRITAVDKKEPKSKKGCTVRKVTSQQVVYGMDCFWSSDWKLWVCGTCGKGGKGCLIQIAANRVTGTVNSGVLVHESAHYFLIDVYNEWMHPVRYAKQFFNWREPRMKSLILVNLEGFEVHVDGFEPSDEYPPPDTSKEPVDKLRLRTILDKA